MGLLDAVSWINKIKINENQVPTKTKPWPIPLRKSSRTSLKRRLRWSEKNPEFGAFEQPDQFAGPSCVQNQDVPVSKAKAEHQPQPPKRVKGEEAARAAEGWAMNNNKHLSFNKFVPTVSSQGVVRIPNRSIKLFNIRGFQLTIIIKTP